MFSRSSLPGAGDIGRPYVLSLHLVLMCRRACRAWGTVGTRARCIKDFVSYPAEDASISDRQSAVHIKFPQFPPSKGVDGADLGANAQHRCIGDSLEAARMCDRSCSPVAPIAGRFPDCHFLASLKAWITTFGPSFIS